MQNKRPNTRILFLFVLLLSMTALACQSLTFTNQPNAQPTEIVVQVVPQATPASAVVSQIVTEDQVLVDLYARVNPSVVNITIYSSSGSQMIALGQGSGFVYDVDGHIVTNSHVVHGADEIEVTFYDGLTREATLVGEDLHSDLAVVKVELPNGVQPLPLGDMNELAVGQTVVAIGNPFGLSGTLTRGIISAMGRTIPALTIFSIPQAIQTDAAINPGNSGGPLLDLNGKVIGVNAQIETSSTSGSNSGVGFAIPVSIIRQVVPSLVQNGEYVWAWLGVRGYDVTPLLVEAMNLPVEQGAYLVDIISGGPASKVGLQGSSDMVSVNGHTVEVGGDVITAVDGRPVHSFDDVLIYIALETVPGQEVNLTILRDGKYREVNVTLEPRPEE